MPIRSQRQGHYIVSSQMATDALINSAPLCSCQNSAPVSGPARTGRSTLFPARRDYLIRTSDQVFCVPPTFRLITSCLCRARRVAYMRHSTDIYRNVVRRTLGKWQFARLWKNRVANTFLSFFCLGARWGWVVNATHRPLLPGKQTRYSSYRKLFGSQGRSGMVRKISPPTGIPSPDSPARSESLYKLRYSGPGI